jgi:hypothetical protein
MDKEWRLDHAELDEIKEQHLAGGCSQQNR